MAFQILKTQPIGIVTGGSIPGTLVVSGGTVLSVGFQNLGNIADCYASQMFVQDDLQSAYVQVANRSSKDIDVVFVLVVSAPDGTTPTIDWFYNG